MSARKKHEAVNGITTRVQHVTFTRLNTFSLLKDVHVREDAGKQYVHYFTT
jgi:hypothetical protein